MIDVRHVVEYRQIRTRRVMRILRVNPPMFGEYPNFGRFRLRQGGTRSTNIIPTINSHRKAKQKLYRQVSDTYNRDNVHWDNTVAYGHAFQTRYCVVV